MGCPTSFVVGYVREIIIPNCGQWPFTEFNSSDVFLQRQSTVMAGAIGSRVGRHARTQGSLTIRLKEINRVVIVFLEAHRFFI